METQSVIDSTWSKLIFPQDVQTIQETEKNGIFAIEPLAPGFGAFVGNSLRLQPSSGPLLRYRIAWNKSLAG